MISLMVMEWEWEKEMANKKTEITGKRGSSNIMAYPPFLPNVLRRRTSTLWVVGGGTGDNKHWNTKRILSPVSPPGEKRKNLPLYWEALTHLSNG